MFNLSRYFSTLSFILIVLAAGALGPLYRQLSLQQMTSQAEDRNLATARILHNTLWPAVGDILRESYGKEAAALGTTPGLPALRERMASVLAGTAVARVRVYNRLGLVVLATEAGGIGTQVDSAAFRAAVSGTTGSDHQYLASVETLDGRRRNVDLLSTFIPVRGQNNDVEGVIELGQDVTPFLVGVNHTLWWMTAGVVGVFALLYLMQFLVVRRAHQILRLQETKIEAARSTLELQVEQRTAELKRANTQLQEEIAERRQAESKLNYLAYHDPLTGLPNRRCFIERLAESLDDSEKHAQRLAVLFIDLDQFKQVNDSLGHTIGDELLVAVASRLSQKVRLIDMLARLGGDEFICLMEAVREDEEAAQLAREIIAAFDAPFVVAGHELYLSTSVGISLFPQDGDSVGNLMRNADSAMYRAKAMGRGHYHFYTPAMTDEVREKVRMENLLRRAIENGELEVHLQPQVDSVSGCLTGAEALVRWHSPELGEVPPLRFIPVAEESGLIIGLGTWVLRESCRQVMRWRMAGFDLPEVSVNLSVKQLERPEFIDILTGILEETGLEPERLKLELTESVVMAVENAFALLERLRDLGIRLAIDDFGTGYSSLNYLKLLPIQQLKIDRSFVIGIGNNHGDEAIIRTVMALAKSLDLDVVAEGVETGEQADFLKDLGCQHLQGFLHGKPVDPAEFAARWGGRSDTP